MRFKQLLIELTLLFIITVPTFTNLLNNSYFSMHDDQHVVRLHLLDKGIKEGYLYPRWVDELGFGFGYPLYNFYPPLVYYVAELFHLLGFSLIWSVKLTFILGFFLSSAGIYFLMKRLTNTYAAYLSSTLYTYFFYHAVLIYVRGALAEFFSLAILPLLILLLHNLYTNRNLKGSIFFGLFFALLILTHPLVAFPAALFLLLFSIFYTLLSKNKLDFLKRLVLGGVIGLGLSSFYWLPSLLERKYTLVNQILTQELANYKIHYIHPQQFLYSPWGYGGSAKGLSDGMTFQLGKIHIGLVLLSIILVCIYFFKKKKTDFYILYFLFSIFLLFFSLFMTTDYSSFIWDKINYLWYLQFPWRFLTFVGFFISIIGGYFIFFLSRLLQQYIQHPRLDLIIRSGKTVITIVIIAAIIVTYQKYFKPQNYLNTSDNKLITFDEISWRTSRTSYEFVPKEVKTKKTELGTTVVSINKDDLPKKPYDTFNHSADIQVIENKSQKKSFLGNFENPTRFKLNTYNFPGWAAYIDEKETVIDDRNDLKLVTVDVPKGKHIVSFIFGETSIRRLSEMITTISLLAVTIILLQQMQTAYLKSSKR